MGESLGLLILFCIAALIGFMFGYETGSRITKEEIFQELKKKGRIP